MEFLRSLSRGFREHGIRRGGLRMFAFGLIPAAVLVYCCTDWRGEEKGIKELYREVMTLADEDHNLSNGISPKRIGDAYSRMGLGEIDLYGLP